MIKKLCLLFQVLFLFFSFGCGGMKPPAPPPPTGAYCGDHVCQLDAGETPSTCPTDCKEEPPPPPPPNKCGNGICDPGENSHNCIDDCPVTPPPPSKCDPSKYIYDECPKIEKDHSQHIILGNYVGTTGQPKFDFNSYYKLFNKFNGESVHLISPWNNLGFYPWKLLSNGKYDLTKWEEGWWTQYRNKLKSAEYYDVEVELCMLDQYGTAKWAANHGISKTHPFRNNIQGKNVADGDWLYKNWNRRLPVDKNVTLWSWTDEFDVSTYKAVGAGIAIRAYFERAAKEAYDVWKNGKLRLMIRTANEPLMIVQEDGKTFEVDKSREIDGRTEILVYETFKKAGFREGEKYHFVHEIETTFSDHRTPAFWWPSKTMRQYIVPRKRIAEWHGICNATDLNVFWKEDSNFKSPYFMGSMDGCKGEYTKEYFDGARSIFKLKPTYFDYKLPACYGGAQCWSETDMNHNVSIFIPKFEQELKK